LVLGPDGRDICDGFSLTDSKTVYPAFWGYDSSKLCKLNQKHNKYLNSLVSPLPGRKLREANALWKQAGTLMLPKELRVNTSSMVAIVLDSEALSNVWWPARWKSNDESIRRRMERYLTLWFNSTLGLFTMLMQRQDT
jgi:hypothetical protein